MKRVGLVVAALGLVLAGCASAARRCDGARNRGWFSGWQSGGGSVFSNDTSLNNHAWCVRGGMNADQY